MSWQLARTPHVLCDEENEKLKCPMRMGMPIVLMGVWMQVPHKCLLLLYLWLTQYIRFMNRKNIIAESDCSLEPIDEVEKTREMGQ